MVNNYFTLRALVEEIRGEFVRSTIEACFTRVESTLEIIVSKASVPPRSLIISCRPKSNWMFTRPAPRRHSGANVLHDAIGKTIVSLDVIPNERTVIIGLDGGYSIVVNLFGPHANVHLFGGNSNLIGSFLKTNRQPEPVVVRKTIDIEDREEFLAGFNSAAGSLFQKLTAVVPSFAGELGREAFFRSGGDALLAIAKNKDESIDDGTIIGIRRAVLKMIEELDRPMPRIYYENDQPIMMSLIEMKHLGHMKEERFDSVDSCIGVYSSAAERRTTDITTKSDVLGRLMKRREELVRTIGKIEADLSSNRETIYRNHGDLVMSHLSEISAGAVEFIDSESGDVVRLDPSLTPAQNAQNYYERSKKARESYRQAAARLDEMKKQLKRIEDEIGNISASADSISLAAIAREAKLKEEAQTPFREFETAGYKIYVGKDAKNNDQLTFGFAKPNDVFMHARGVSGSHVIIRNPSREYPQKAVLEFAARIAAHYSKARTSGVVPVTYSMRKFVKKAKGKAGAVFVDREEVIFVKPGIPQTPR